LPVLQSLSQKISRGRESVILPRFRVLRNKGVLLFWQLLLLSSQRVQVEEDVLEVSYNIAYLLTYYRGNRWVEIVDVF